MPCLPKDMEEVLSRVPVRLMGELRSTCKRWNTLTKTKSFVAKKKESRKRLEVVMMLDYRVSLMSVNLLTPSIECIGNLNVDGVYISQIFHCDGLFLCCITKLDKRSSRLLVWNPFLGQTRWIEPTSSYHNRDKYALGYDKEKKSHKVLRFNYSKVKNGRFEFEMYSVHSWKAIYDFSPEPDWFIRPTCLGLSLMGNTYWCAGALDGRPKTPDIPDFLVSFDFTTEKFGPLLPLPFEAFFKDTVTLSSVGEEQLAVLFQKGDSPAYTVKIWISNKIEPNGVSWNNLFLAVDMKPLIGIRFPDFAASFFLDEEKKVAVVLYKDTDESDPPTRNIAYIFGNDGSSKQLDLGESRDIWCYPLVCSYVPSSVKIAPP